MNHIESCHTPHRNGIIFIVKFCIGFWFCRKYSLMHLNCSMDCSFWKCDEITKRSKFIHHYTLWSVSSECHLNSTATQNIILTHLPFIKWPPFLHMAFSNVFFSMKIIEFWFEFHWNLIPGVQLKISQHCSRSKLGAKQATNHYLNQCWPSSLMHICGTRARWVNQ